MVAQLIRPVELAVIAVKRAMAEGASEAEAYVTYSRGLSVGMFAGRIKDVEYERDIGIGVRVAVGKRVAFAYATGSDPAAAYEAARRAVKLARVSPPDDKWPGLPEPSPRYPEPGNMYDASLARVLPETLVEEARRLIDYVAEFREKGVQLSRASIGVTVTERAIANSNGVYRTDTGTHAYVLVSTVAVANGITTPAIFAYDTSRVALPSVTAVADKAIRLSLLATKRGPRLDPGRYTVVYAPPAFADIYESTVATALLGDMVVRGRSYYRDKLGEKVMDERLTIIDDGTLKGGDATWRFDGEGVAMQRTILVEKGVLRGFVYDTYWGSRAGVSSTGNAVRAGYASRPHVGFTNTLVEGGDAGMDDILDGRVVVVYQVQGAHTANPETGEYSVLANPAILYENGEPKGWVPGLVVSGNFYKELSGSVEMVSKIVEKPYPGMYMPWIRLAGVTAAPRG